MYNAKEFRYIIPINPEKEGETQTVDIVSIYSSASGRLSLMTKYLRHKYTMTRKEAHATIIALGFDDLIPCPVS